MIETILLQITLVQNCAYQSWIHKFWKKEKASPLTMEKKNTISKQNYILGKKNYFNLI